MSGDQPNTPPPGGAQPPAAAAAAPAPAGAPAPAPAAPAASPDAPPAAPAPPEAITFADSKALDARLDRARVNARKQMLGELGFDSEEALAEFKKNADEQAKAAEEARRAEMGELERYRADLEKETQARQEADAKTAAALREAEDARYELHVRQLCAARGINNVDYAAWLINAKLDALDEDEILDEAKFLDELLADENQKGALGIAPVPPREGEANTASPKMKPDPVPGTDGGEKSALDMTPEEFAKKLAEEGIHL